MGYYRRLFAPRVWRKIAYERLTEPLHLNILSLFVMAFGSFRWKVAFDLVARRYYAYGILRAADWAVAQSTPEIMVVEFGVAAGAGLINAAMIAQKVQKATGVKINVVGFDSGTGMPPPVDYRDHPDIYAPGDFPMDVEKLKAHLPPNTSLVLGDVAATVPQFVGKLQAPIGFVAFDLDYYSSTKAALTIFDAAPESYLPLVYCYFDDLSHEAHNSWCGELLAIHEFNAAHPLRKIERFSMLENRRIFSRAAWLKHMYNLHVLDHPFRQTGEQRAQLELPNPYL